MTARARSRSGAVAVLALLLQACAASFGPPEPLGCTNDSDCPDTMVCFVDGCGDPGQNLALEVRPLDGAEQDFEVDGGLRPYQTIKLFPASMVVGTVVRGLPDGGTSVYSGGISVTARGESVLIPGRERRAGPVSPDSLGEYRLPVGSGTHTVTASSSNPELPPMIYPHVTVWPSDEARVNVYLPPQDALVRLDGQVVRTAGDVVTERLQIEALDPVSRRPLSQRLPVADGGTFALTALQPSSGLSMLLRVTSSEANALVPQKEFSVYWPSDTLPPLELGNFGEPVTATGRVLGPDGGVVVGAAVVLSGQVPGGGEFRSAVNTTGLDGTFSVVTLPSTSLGMRLLVIPPVPGVAGVLEKNVLVPAAGAPLGDVTCPARVQVKGTLLRPDGAPAAGVQVTAEPVAKLNGAEHAGALFEGRTAADGSFELALDPAIYRFDFTPGETLPRRSQMVTVPAGGPAPPPLILDSPLTLSWGRTLRGIVLQRVVGKTEPVPAPAATVRFFRKISIDGKPGSVVVASGITDYSGTFEVVLPETRDGTP